MTSTFDTSSLEAKILLLLVEVYPITIDEIADYLKSSKTKVKNSIKVLAKKGLIALEPLPDKVFVTLASGDFQFTGRETEQVKKVQEKLKKRQQQPIEDYEGMMYG
jgi:predicted transcriptional regulator